MANETAILTLRVTLQGRIVGADNLMQTIDYTYEIPFTDGTGNNQLNTVYQDLARPLNATSETLDLDGLTILGATASDANAVKFILARYKSTTTAEVMKIGGGDFAAATGPVADSTDKIVTGPDGLILLVNPRDGWGITASTKDGLVTELTGNSTYDVIIGLDNA